MLAKEHIDFFTNLLGKNFSTQPHYLQAYSYDSTRLSFLPDAVIFPKDEAEISKIMSYCNQHKIPVIPRGAGSGMSGGALAFKGGIILALEKYFNKILEIDSKNMLVCVQPGLRNKELQNALEELNLFYPPDPASMEFSTIGGNVAENAGGMKAAKYGTTKDYVLALRAVLPNGKIIRVGKKTIKDVAGYNLAGILIASEGTLGIITEITLKVLSKPKFSCSLIASFADFKDAMNAVYESMSSGISPVAMEFLDQLTLQAVKNKIKDNDELALFFDANALLVCELDSMYEDSLMMQTKALEIIFKNNACLQTKISHTKQESDLIWSIRRNASQATTCYGVKKLNEDITVPRSNLKALLDGIYTIGQKYGFDIPCFGHAGDGNVHVNVMLKNDDQKTLDQGHSAIKEIFQLAINLEGTLSGEHGIGISKAEFMSLAFNQAELDLMRSIKKAFDPNNILNPHKMGL